MLNAQSMPNTTPIVLSFSNIKYWPWLLNAATHLSQLGEGAPLLTAHALDDETLQRCEAAALPRVSCVRAACCSASDSPLHGLTSRALMEAALVYKLQAAHEALSAYVDGRPGARCSPQSPK